MQLSVSTLGMPVLAHASGTQTEAKVNDKTTDARQFGQSQLNAMAGQQAESWLNGFGGSSRVSISSETNFSKYNYAGDVLVPLWDSRDFMIFSQLGARHADERTTGNIGVGSRYFIDGWMLGNNIFFDNDFSGNNRRVGIGAEIWTDALRLAANGYYGLNGWHESKALMDHDERPANGWDIELASWLPMYPQLGGKLKYEQYYGDNVALMSRGNRQKNPSAVTMGANWTPVPLVTIDAGHRKNMQSGGDTTVGLNLNWNFGHSLDWHLSPDAVADQRSLLGSRYELVSRNNQIVMDYREQTVITFSLASAIKGVEGTPQSLGVSVWAKHGLGKIVWNDAALVAAGGKITGTGANSVLVLPAFKDGANNSYTLSAVAYDTKGKASPSAQVQITVEKAQQVPEEPQQPEEPGQPGQPEQPEEPAQPGQPDAGQTTATLTSGQLVADGNGKTELVVELKDKDGQPVSGQAGNLNLEATLQNTLRSGNTGVTVGQFNEDGQQPGRYLVDVTAGTEAGVVTLTLYHGNTQMGQPQQLTLTAANTPSSTPASVELTAPQGAVIAGQTMTFTATVKDKEGNPVKDVVVNFTDDKGNIIPAVNDGKTDAQGKATATLMKEKVGIYTVISHAGELESAPQAATVVPDLDSAQVQSQSGNTRSFTPGVVEEDGTPLTLHFSFYDKFRNLIANTNIEFKAEEEGADEMVNITAQDGMTGEYGNAIATVTMKKAHTVKTEYHIYAVINGKRVPGPTPVAGYVPR